MHSSGRPLVLLTVALALVMTAGDALALGNRPPKCTQADKDKMAVLNDQINDLIAQSRQLNNQMEAASQNGDDELYEDLLASTMM